MDRVQRLRYNYVAYRFTDELSIRQLCLVTNRLSNLRLGLKCGIDDGTCGLKGEKAAAGLFDWERRGKARSKIT